MVRLLPNFHLYPLFVNVALVSLRWSVYRIQVEVPLLMIQLRKRTSIKLIGEDIEDP